MGGSVRICVDLSMELHVGVWYMCARACVYVCMCVCVCNMISVWVCGCGCGCEG